MMMSSTPIVLMMMMLLSVLIKMLMMISKPASHARAKGKDLTFELKFLLKPIVYEYNKVLYIEEKMWIFWKSIARVIAVTAVLNLWRRRSKLVYYQINQRPRICSDTLVTGIAQVTLLVVRNQEPTFSRLKFRGFLILAKEQPTWFWYKSKLVAHWESDCRRSRHDARSGG